MYQSIKRIGIDLNNPKLKKGIDLNNPKLKKGINYFKIILKKSKHSCITKEKETIKKYGDLFSPRNLDKLSKEKFWEFTNIKYNNHWGAISRHNSEITKNIGKLKRALKLLLNEKIPLEKRLNSLIPKHKPGPIKGLRKSILTPILFLVYPSRYCVLNEVTRDGMKFYGVYPFKKEPTLFSDEYKEVNKVITSITKKYGLTRWQVDLLWSIQPNSKKQVEKWLKEEEGFEENIIENIIKDEKQLKNYILKKWDSIKGLKNNLKIYEKEGSAIPKGKEYSLSRGGYIDFLCEGKEGYVIIEVKMKATERVVGQVFRYMNYLKEDIERGRLKKRKVKRVIIICLDTDKEIKAAVAELKNKKIDIQIKKIDLTFQLIDFGK